MSLYTLNIYCVSISHQNSSGNQKCNILIQPIYSIRCCETVDEPREVVRRKRYESLLTYIIHCFISEIINIFFHYLVQKLLRCLFGDHIFSTVQTLSHRRNAGDLLLLCRSFHDESSVNGRSLSPPVTTRTRFASCKDSKHSLRLFSLATTTL